MAIVFASVSGLLRDSGFSTFVLQRFSLSARIVSALHYLSCGIGVIFAVAMICLGPWLARSYGDARYTLFALVLAACFIFCSISAVPTALLARNLNFRLLAAIDVVTVVVSSAASLLLALHGVGAWALIVQATVLTALQCIGVLAICQWWPSKPARWRELKGTVSFAGSVSVVQGLNYASANLDNLIAASFFGTRVAGLYAQAFQLLVIPLQQINGPLQRVFVPTLSRLNRDPERFAKFFRAIVSVIGFTLWPIFAVLYVFAESIIVILFGPEWVESVAIFKVLVFVGLAQSIGYVNTWLFTATGQIRRQTIWTFISKPLLISSFFIGLPWGVQGMATSYAIASAVVVIPAFIIASKRIGLRLVDLLSPMFLPSLLAMASLALALSLHTLLPPGNDLMKLVVDLSGVFLGAISFAFAVPPIRRRVMELGRQVIAR